MEAVKVVFNGRETSYTVRCQNCHRKKTLRHSQLRHLSNTVKVKCKCGVVFDLVFERRRFYRKRVQLEAQLLDSTSSEKLDDITITTLSVGGVGFVSHLDTIKEGNTYRVMFYLDDASKALVSEDIVIRNASNEVFGAEFVRQDTYSYELDFYLMPISVVD